MNIDCDGAWAIYLQYQEKLSKLQHHEQADTRLSACCDFLAEYIDSGKFPIEKAELVKLTEAAGKNATRRTTRRVAISTDPANEKSILETYHRPMISSEIFLMDLEEKSQVMSHLSALNRSIVERLIFGFRQKEIANDLGFSHAAIRKRISRIRKQEDHS